MIFTDKQRQTIEAASSIVICQAENPDGDSIGSAIALEEILSDLGKTVSLHCPVQLPSYLHYIPGWDRVSMDFDTKADMAIIVDTSAKGLMSKTLDDPAILNFFVTKPVIVLDHHGGVEPDLPFTADYLIDETAVATGELILDLALAENWPINQKAASSLFISIQTDSLGLTTAGTTSKSFRSCADLIDRGANPAEIENARRELMKKSSRILAYKGQLIERIEYYNNNRTAYIHIPFEEIHEYSNEYNPTMLVLDEMRLVIGVDVAIGIKSYPDGKLTGKIRSNIPVANLLAKAFGGDGHPYAAGFRTYVNIDEFMPELMRELNKIYDEYDNQANTSDIDPVDEALTKAEQTVKHADLAGSDLGNFKIKRRK